MLIHFGMIDGVPEKHFLETEILEFLQEIKVKTDEWMYRENFKSFNTLVPGQIIGYDWDRVIKNEYPFNVIYGIVAKYPEKWGSAWFLFTIKK